MATVMVVYHSGYGHTRRVAEVISSGAREGGATSEALSVDTLRSDLSSLDRADALVFGCPTYMGGPSAGFKAFMDSTTRIWMNRGWKDKLAAGFTNSGSLHGDKQTTLFVLMTYAAQHGMIWIPQTELSTPRDGEHGSRPEDVNRVGASIGLMTQSDNRPADETPSSGDLETARRFGVRIAEIARRWVRS